MEAPPEKIEPLRRRTALLAAKELNGLIDLDVHRVITCRAILAIAAACGSSAPQ